MLQQQNTREETAATISVVKKRYQEKEALLQKSINAAIVREMEASQQIKEESSRINSLADYKIASTKECLEKKYQTAREEQDYACYNCMVFK